MTTNNHHIKSRTHSLTAAFVAGAAITTLAFSAIAQAQQAQVAARNEQRSEQKNEQYGDQPPTHHTFVPASVNIQELKKNLQTSKVLPAALEGTFDVVVYLNSKGEIETLNYEAANMPQNEAANNVLRSALAAVRKTPFTPALRNDQPVSSAVKIPFKLLF